MHRLRPDHGLEPADHKGRTEPLLAGPQDDQTMPVGGGTDDQIRVELLQLDSEQFQLSRAELLGTGQTEAMGQLMADRQNGENA